MAKYRYKEGMNNALNFIKSVENRLGLKTSCLEEVARRKDFTDANQLDEIDETFPNHYSQYLERIIAQKTLFNSNYY